MWIYFQQKSKQKTLPEYLILHCVKIVTCMPILRHNLIGLSNVNNAFMLISIKGHFIIDKNPPKVDDGQQLGGSLTV